MHLPMPTAAIEVGGSCDVGDVSWNVPTMGAIYDSWPQDIPPHQWGCTACHGMSIGRKATINAVKVVASAAVDLLTQPDLTKAAWEEFEKQKKGKTYKSLNELEKPPGGELLPDDRHHYECCIHGAMEHFGIEEASVVTKKLMSFPKTFKYTQPNQVRKQWLF